MLEARLTELSQYKAQPATCLKPQYSHFSEIADSLASEQISGERSIAKFMRLIGLNALYESCFCDKIL